MSYIPRDAERMLEAALRNEGAQRDVIFVEGARQVGKTSMVRHVCSKYAHLWLDLEKEKTFLRKLDATTTFDEFGDLLVAEKKFTPGKNKILVLDEAQESRVLGGYIRYFKEIWKHQTVIVMGSIMARLFRQGVRYPVGRIQSIKLYPLTFEEFLMALHEDMLLENLRTWEPQQPLTTPLHEKGLELYLAYLTTGGLPEVVQRYHRKEAWEEKLNNLAFGYTEDFKRVEGEEKSSLFELSLKRIAQTLGSPSKLSTLLATHQPGYRHLPGIVNLLENWMLVHKVEVETPAAPGITRIPPKRYLFDQGIRHVFSPVALRLPTLTGMEGQIDTTYLGGIFENSVLNQIKPLETQKTVTWRKSINGSEVDFLFSKDREVIPIEVKATDKTNRRHFSSLEEFLSFSGQKSALLVSGASGGIYSVGKKRIFQAPFYAVSQVLREGVKSLL